MQGGSGNEWAVSMLRIHCRSDWRLMILMLLDTHRITHIYGDGKNIFTVHHIAQLGCQSIISSEFFYRFGSGGQSTESYPLVLDVSMVSGLGRGICTDILDQISPKRYLDYSCLFWIILYLFCFGSMILMA